MKKTLIAASIAALTATSANAAVKIYESETGSLSSFGKVQLELENYDGESVIQDQGSRFGFTGEQELKHDLTAIFNAEFRYNAGVNDDDAEFETRDTYFGVKGDFGTVKAGNFDSIVYSTVTKQADIMENLGYRSLDTGSNNARATGLAYETNDLSGFKLAVGVKHYASEKSKYALDEDGEFDASNANPALATEKNEEWNLQIGGTYQLNDELSFGLAVDQNNKKGNPASGYIDGSSIDSDPIIAAKVNYKTDQFGAGLVVEQTKEIIVTNLTGSVNYGAGDVYALVSFADVGKKASYANFDGQRNESGVDFALGANYNLSDDFFVYGEVAVGNKKVSEIQKPNYKNVDEDDFKAKGATAVTVGAAYKW